MKSQPFTTSMQSQSAPEQRQKEEIERLLARLRRQVAQLHRLERAPRDESGLHDRDLDSRRHAIAELQWRLARLVGDHSRRSLVAG
jgi:hypothetical protein